jgi:hypothetical protein
MSPFSTAYRNLRLLFPWLAMGYKYNPRFHRLKFYYPELAFVDDIFLRIKVETDTK